MHWLIYESGSRNVINKTVPLRWLWKETGILFRPPLLFRNTDSDYHQSNPRSLQSFWKMCFLSFFWQPQIHNKLIWLRAESYQAPAFHWLPAWPNWCLTVSLVVWRKSLCCTNPHRVTGGATHLQARIYILFVSPQKIIRPQRKQMATVNCPVGGASASLSLWTEAFKRISLFQQGVRQVFCSCAVSALGNQTGIICVLTADSPRLHKYLRNNPQPIRRGQTHSCNICGYNVLSAKKKKKSFTVTSVYLPLYRDHRQDPAFFTGLFFLSRKSESPLKWCVDWGGKQGIKASTGE